MDAARHQIHSDDEQVDNQRNVDALAQEFCEGDAELARPARILARRLKGYGITTDSEMLTAQVMIDLAVAKALKRIADALEADRG